MPKYLWALVTISVATFCAAVALFYVRTSADSARRKHDQYCMNQFRWLESDSALARSSALNALINPVDYPCGPPQIKLGLHYMQTDEDELVRVKTGFLMARRLSSTTESQRKAIFIAYSHSMMEDASPQNQELFAGLLETAIPDHFPVDNSLITLWHKASNSKNKTVRDTAKQLLARYNGN